MAGGNVISGAVADGGGIGSYGFALNSTNEGVLSGYIARNLDPSDGVGVLLHEGPPAPTNVMLSSGLIIAQKGIYINGDVDTVRITDHVIVGDGSSSIGIHIIASSAATGPVLIEGLTAVDCDSAVISVYSGSGITLSDWTIRNIQVSNCGTVLTTTNITWDTSCVIELPDMSSVGSGATITLPYTRTVLVTGTADITSISAQYPGRAVTLLFNGTAATNGLVDGSNLKLSANLAYTPDDAIDLVCDGTNWYETGRSVN